MGVSTVPEMPVTVRRCRRFPAPSARKRSCSVGVDNPPDRWFCTHPMLHESAPCTCPSGIWPFSATGHPRIRGEHGHPRLAFRLLSGSSPRPRGARARRDRVGRARRIIPASAGSTLAELQRWSAFGSFHFSLLSRVVLCDPTFRSLFREVVGARPDAARTSAGARANDLPVARTRRRRGLVRGTGFGWVGFGESFVRFTRDLSLGIVVPSVNSLPGDI